MHVRDMLLIVLWTIVCSFGWLHFLVPRLQTLNVFHPKRMQFNAIPPGASLRFVPVPHHNSSSTSSSYSSREDVIACVHYPVPEHIQPNGFTMLYFHGRAGNVARTAHAWKQDALHGFEVFAVDYRGYGLSTGKATPDNFERDALTALRYVTSLRPASKVVVHGYSLGCVAAIRAAAASSRGSASPPVAGLVVESPFLNLREAVLHLYPGLRWFARFMDPVFRNDTWMQQVSPRTTVVVLHSPHDETVNPHDAQQLFHVCPAKHKKLFASIKPSHAGPHLTQRSYNWLLEHLPNDST